MSHSNRTCGIKKKAFFLSRSLQLTIQPTTDGLFFLIYNIQQQKFTTFNSRTCILFFITCTLCFCVVRPNKWGGGGVFTYTQLQASPTFPQIHNISLSIVFAGYKCWNKSTYTDIYSLCTFYNTWWWWQNIEI